MKGNVTKGLELFAGLDKQQQNGIHASRFKDSK